MHGRKGMSERGTPSCACAPFLKERARITRFSVRLLACFFVRFFFFLLVVRSLWAHRGLSMVRVSGTGRGETLNRWARGSYHFRSPSWDCGWLRAWGSGSSPSWGCGWPPAWGWDCGSRPVWGCGSRPVWGCGSSLAWGWESAP